MEVEDTGSNILMATDFEATSDVKADDFGSDTEHENSDNVDTAFEIGTSDVAGEDTVQKLPSGMLSGIDALRGEKSINPSLLHISLFSVF